MMSEIKYQVESLFDILDELMPLLCTHWSEVEDGPFDPDWVSYELLDSCGKYVLLTARLDDQIIGYTGTILSPRLQSKEQIIGNVELLYIISERRGGGLVKNLLGFTEKVLIAAGVNEMLLSFKTQLDNGTFCTKLGYVPKVNIYGKTLENTDVYRS